MDGVLVAYPKTGKPKSFLNLQPIEGAVEAFKLLDRHFEVYIASTAPWSNPQAWMDKRLWCEKYLGKHSYKKLCLTHNKQMLIGDYLIDDRPNNGAKQFRGKWIQFGSPQYPDWGSVLSFLKIDNPKAA